MKRLLLALLLLTLCLSAALWPVLPLWAQEPYVVGDTVDNFTLPNQNGVDVSLYDYSNNIKFLVFWQPG
jgi:hypothetical protein